MTKDIEREAFLEYWRENNLPYDGDDADKEKCFEYWLAAKAHEAEKLKGCVVVPVESIEAALLWMDEDIDAHHMSNEGFDKLFEHKPILEKILLEAARGGNE